MGNLLSNHFKEIALLNEFQAPAAGGWQVMSEFIEPHFFRMAGIALLIVLLQRQSTFPPGAESNGQLTRDSTIAYVFGLADNRIRP